MIQNIFAAIIIIALLYCAVKHIVDLTIYPSKKKYKKGTQQKELPDNMATPAQVAFLYYYNENILHANIMGNVVIAMLLDLVRKKFIQLKRTKLSIEISLVENAPVNMLNDEEKILYEQIAIQIGKENNKITLDQFANYMRKNATLFGKCMNNILIKAKIREEKEGKYKESQERNVHKYVILSVIYVFAGFASLLFTNLVILIAIFDGLLCSIIAHRLNNLTLKGMEEKNQWMAVETYIQDMPHKDLRTVPSLLELEQYYVYMVTFGKALVAEKAIKETYRQMEELEEDQTYTYMPLLYQDDYFMKELIEQLQEAYQEVYKQGKLMNTQIFK